MTSAIKMDGDNATSRGQLRQQNRSRRLEGAEDDLPAAVAAGIGSHLSGFPLDFCNLFIDNESVTGYPPKLTLLSGPPRFAVSSRLVTLPGEKSRAAGNASTFQAAQIF